MVRKGIIAVGNWIVDNVKLIGAYPRKGNLATIFRQEEGLGGCAHNVLADLAAMRSGIPLFAGGCIGADRYGQMCLDACDRLGIDRTHLKVLEGTATSYTDVMSETDGDGSRTFFHCRGANAELTVDQVLACKSPARIFIWGISCCSMRWIRRILNTAWRLPGRWTACSVRDMRPRSMWCRRKVTVIARWFFPA